MANDFSYDSVLSVKFDEGYVQALRKEQQGLPLTEREQEILSHTHAYSGFSASGGAARDILEYHGLKPYYPNFVDKGFHDINCTGGSECPLRDFVDGKPTDRCCWAASFRWYLRMCKETRKEAACMHQIIEDGILGEGQQTEVRIAQLERIRVVETHIDVRFLKESTCDGWQVEFGYRLEKALLRSGIIHRLKCPRLLPHGPQQRSVSSWECDGVPDGYYWVVAPYTRGHVRMYRVEGRIWKTPDRFLTVVQIKWIGEHVDVVKYLLDDDEIILL
mmetsp:Transcript_18721/g.51420  ORF Transcript_18721/g.51420 Transcript_18721/m.51420 type:complete len:275 (+) Transcript_18721:64-888(+)|eukprot:CAMPEP_0117536410 /NCGR_PEP_ID=MMETSP0784-20121206/41439_1 /TAXON_ID=39447 /ORGANISM="" /LENGTH=274 /DNA_ID=CAMNT_0005332973 /DNA_START=58 /DNA_END=882 /DNA_ORIENTATION=-